MNKIKKFKILSGYSLWLKFEDGVEGEVDLSYLVGKGVFSIWHDRVKFQNARLETSGEITWEGMADLCPDALYLKVTGKKPEDIFPCLNREPAHA